MKNQILHFLAACILVMLTSTGKAQVSVKDSLALVDLYNSTNGPKWSFNSGWLTSAPVAEWAGVTVSGNRVESLYLSFNNMKGQLPSSIGNLTALKEFDAGFNKLNGVIPASFGNLKNLEVVEVNYNNLSGSIPTSIINLYKLREISFDHNSLTGVIPDSLGKLTKLTYLNLSYNNLNGSLPDLSAVTKLSELNVSHNTLTGTIDEALGSLIKMLVLDLSFNEFSGSIPASLGNLKNLFDLYFNNNQLTGNVPATLQNIPFIFAIDLSNNKLTQSQNIPITGERIFIDLDLRYNSFTFNGLEYAQKKIPNAKYKYQQPIPVHLYNGGLAVSAGGTLSNNTYNWVRIDDSKVTIIQGDSTFTPSESGAYYVTVTNSIAKKLTLVSDTIQYNTIDPLKISVYPNPASKTLFIEGLNINHTYIISIADMNGYVWMSTKLKSQTAEKINISSLRPGRYLITVHNGMLLKTLKFIKE